MILSHEILNFLGTRWWPAGEATSSGNKLWKDVTHLPSFGAKRLSATHSLISKSYMCKIRQTSNLGPGAPDYPALCLSRNAIYHMGIDDRSTCDIPKSCMLSSKQHIDLTKMQPKVIFLNSNRTQKHRTHPKNFESTEPTVGQQPTLIFLYILLWMEEILHHLGWLKPYKISYKSSDKPSINQDFAGPSTGSFPYLSSKEVAAKAQEIAMRHANLQASLPRLQSLAPSTARWLGVCLNMDTVNIVYSIYIYIYTIYIYMYIYIYYVVCLLIFLYHFNHQKS